MNTNILNQLSIFIIFFGAGIIIGFIFDFFRILRKTFKTCDLITYIEDILFFLIVGVILIFIIFTFEEGQIRFFNFIGIFIGIIMYLLVVSNFFIKINVYIIIKIKNILKCIFKNVYKIVFKPIYFLVININKKITKIFNFKLTKKRKNEIIKKDF